MIVKLYDTNISESALSKVCDAIAAGGVVIYPTDGVYAFGCSIQSLKAIEKLKDLCGKSLSELSIMCSSISQIAEFCRVDNAQFKILKRNLPGPFTFILSASSRIPEKALGKRKSIGVRIPDNPISIAIVEHLGTPIVTSSVKSLSEDEEYTTDPELIEEMWGKRVALVVDGGVGYETPSTIVGLDGDEVEILREGVQELK